MQKIINDWKSHVNLLAVSLKKNASPQTSAILKFKYYKLIKYSNNIIFDVICVCILYKNKNFNHILVFLDYRKLH